MRPDFRFMKPSSKTTAMPQSDRTWYARVNSRVYGPFDDETIWSYVQEGRITAQSDLSMRPERGYMPAKDWLEISHWFDAAELSDTPSPEPMRHQPTRYDPPYQTQERPSFSSMSSAPVSMTAKPAMTAQAMDPMLYLVVADIRSGRAASFEQTLDSIGITRSLSDSAWLVEADMPVSDLKSILAPVLTRSDSLLILDATEADFATHNLDSEAEAPPEPPRPSRRRLWR